ncbi:MAG: hypothetical protein AAF618_08135 [Pseudomonadota bacterium]
MGIPVFDFSVKQGNSGTLENPAGLVARLVQADQQPKDLTGAEIVFFASWNGENQLRLTSTANEVLVDATAGRVTVPFDVTIFRMVSSRASVRYELELREGSMQRTVLEGRIKIVGGISDD